LIAQKLSWVEFPEACCQRGLLLLRILHIYKGSLGPPFMRQGLMLLVYLLFFQCSDFNIYSFCMLELIFARTFSASSSLSLPVRSLIRKMILYWARPFLTYYKEVVEGAPSPNLWLMYQQLASTLLSAFV
jgi:hypothetical protein